MRIVTTTTVFPKGIPENELLQRFLRLGYTNLDIAFERFLDKDDPFMSEDYLSWARELRATADALGISFTHAHACADVDYRGKEIFRCLECCGILGVKYIAVHPVFAVNGKVIDDDDEFISLNARYGKELLPYAIENNVTLALENLLWGSSIKPSAIAGVAEAINHKSFGWCFDTGHANSFDVPMSAIRGLPAPVSLHVHDNVGNARDEHMLPGDGIIDWKDFLTSLKAVGYEGDLVLEAHHQPLAAPDSGRDAILTDLLGRAEKMREYYLSL